ncbi:MAG: PrsW family glutamic-type intramembrane protease [Lentisphaerae bacterium]|nr:PrsW family glutamic-type intramembrane protease [Lentisphaerota bacterium]
MIKFSCNHCGQHLEGEDNHAGITLQCPTCNKSICVPLKNTSSAPPPLKKGPPPLKPLPPSPTASGEVAENPESVIGSIVGKISGYVGVDKIEGFSISEFFSSVFKKHSVEEVEDYFTVGTRFTTPDLRDISAVWPKPWAFFRALTISLLAYIAFRIGFNEFGNVKLVPGLIFTGAFAVPLSSLVLFYEVNIVRNVSLYQVFKLVFIGGVLSLVVCLFFYKWFPILPDWFGASSAGIIEEAAKILTVIAVVGWSSKYVFTLNGLLFGAAVGAGFAAFESAGYALEWGLKDVDLMLEGITIRGILAPAAHVVWTALTAAALWKVKGKRKFEYSMLFDFRFVRVFIFSAILHMLWNCPLTLTDIITIPYIYDPKYIILGLVAWVAVFAFMQDGIRQVMHEQTKI